MERAGRPELWYVFQNPEVRHETEEAGVRLSRACQGPRKCGCETLGKSLSPNLLI